jgi:rhodanese-related sulfurtransferase
VCAAGVRSETAARLAAQLGFKEVYNLTGGTRAWLKAGLPLEREAAVTAA